MWMQLYSFIVYIGISNISGIMSHAVGQIWLFNFQIQNVILRHNKFTNYIFLIPFDKKTNFQIYACLSEI